MNTTTKKIRVILADDHPLVRAGIRSSIEAEEDILVVAEAANGYDIKGICQTYPFDILILDLSMPGPSARETVAYINDHCPKSMVIILTAYEDEIYIKTLLSLGIKGYILKDEATEVVVTAIRSVDKGGTWFSQRVVEKLINPKMGAGIEGLSARELGVINLMKDGFTIKEIALKLGVTERTIRYHTENIMQKLRARNRIEAITIAIKKGLINP